MLILHSLKLTGEKWCTDPFTLSLCHREANYGCKAAIEKTIEAGSSAGLIVTGHLPARSEGHLTGVSTAVSSSANVFLLETDFDGVWGFFMPPPGLRRCGHLWKGRSCKRVSEPGFTWRGESPSLRLFSNDSVRLCLWSCCCPDG